jgi:hypothetical protein
LEFAVVVAVVSMDMMEMIADQIVGVVAVWDRLVAAAGAMPMAALVTATCVLRRADIGIAGIDGDDVLVHVIPVHVVQMSVMQIVDMALMAHGRVAAVEAMLVRMIAVLLIVAAGHRIVSSVVAAAFAVGGTRSMA